MLCFMQSSLHVDGCEGLLPEHPMPAALRVCGKLAVLDDLLIKLLATGHKVCMDSCRFAAYLIPSLREHLHLALCLDTMLQATSAHRAPPCQSCAYLGEALLLGLAAGAGVQHNDAAAGHPGGPSGMAWH